MIPFDLLSFVLLSLLSLMLFIYQARQAASLRAVQTAVQDYYAMQFRAARRAFAGSLDALDPFAWVSGHVSAGLDKPLSVTDVIRFVPEVQALDLRTGDNRRVVVSPHPWRDLFAFDRRARHVRAGDRLSDFAVRPLLNRSPFGWGVRVVEAWTCHTDEFFDLEAEAAGRKLGAQWNQPTRLFFYVVE